VSSTDQPREVCICGSMRFEAEMRQAAIEESLAGRIVLMPHVNMRVAGPWSTDPERAEEIKNGLDCLHFAKINRADEVLVVCPGDYIGESTAREIAYATELGLPVRYRRETSRDLAEVRRELDSVQAVLVDVLGKGTERLTPLALARSVGQRINKIGRERDSAQAALEEARAALGRAERLAEERLMTSLRLGHELSTLRPGTDSKGERAS
jgi:hypothetical protein